ncbi:MAG: Uma2 family endonuclease [Acidobacteria bacterium]|nr:Uma2 family endonuclease [Acidobacteriota bacterium]
MSKLQKRVTIPPEEYLEGEKYSEVRHEYARGCVYAMVGASKAHNLIVGNLHAALHAHLPTKT